MLAKLRDYIKDLADGKIALTLFILALLLRILYAVVYYFTQPIPESNLYYELAQDIIAQGKILYETSDPYYEFPGPVIIWINALTMLIFGKNYLGLYLVTALVSALITFFTYKTARLFLDNTTSFIVGIWSAFYFFYFYYTPSPGKDIWMAFFMIFLIHELLVLFMHKQFTWKRYLVFIVMFALSFHLDERFFLFSPFLFFYILCIETNGLKAFAWKKSVALVGFTMLLMVPWTIRNYQKHEKIVFISTRTEVFTDPIFGYEPRSHIMDEFNDIYGIYYIHEHQYDSVITGKKTHTDKGRKILPEMVQAMKRGEMPQPLTGFRAFGIRLLSMFEPFQIKGRYERSGYVYYKKSLRNNLATLFSYGVLFIFSFVGFYFLYKANRTVFYVFLTIILVWALVHALSVPYTNWRYRLPLDAIFIIVGWLGAILVFERKIQFE